jgi:hypothetical protein
LKAVNVACSPHLQVLACSAWIYAPLESCVSQTDGLRDKSSLASEVPSFCSDTSTMSSLKICYSNQTSTFRITRGRYLYLIGLVGLIARLSAMICAKRGYVTKKSTVIIAHICSKTAIFGPLNSFRQYQSNRYKVCNGAHGGFPIEPNFFNRMHMYLNRR